MVAPEGFSDVTGLVMLIISIVLYAKQVLTREDKHYKNKPSYIISGRRLIDK